mmetsp:Transcript_972/g.2742  ORF Transcript_972/g.2742 Transcript_972/m.2742 type:complete len:327 (-) Transcript_972:755-1735(-)
MRHGRDVEAQLASRHAASMSFAEGYRRFSESRELVTLEHARADSESGGVGTGTASRRAANGALKRGDAEREWARRASESASGEETEELEESCGRECAAGSLQRQDTQSSYRSFLQRHKSISLENDVQARKSKLLEGVSALSSKPCEDSGLERRAPRRSSKRQPKPKEQCTRCAALREELEVLRLEQKALESALKARTLMITGASKTPNSHRRKNSSSFVLSNMFSGPGPPRLGPPAPLSAARSAEHAFKAAQVSQVMPSFRTGTQHQPNHAPVAPAGVSAFPTFNPASSASSSSLRLLRQEVENLRTTADFLYHQLDAATRAKNAS